ncbi:MAG: hypothetical protein F4139_09040 [Gemmatimonadetes bacterium]|nr:hypothetical protein [Gemmatimonadota bacterium]MYH53083.1 hypothetical protein [Gemmatimonadota bacterium]MYK65736.1 hypothetical protein [Gemmatimonadota bacterium]
MIRRVMLLAVLGLGCEDAPTAPPNRAPTAGQIPVQTLHVGERLTLDLSGYFADPDGDALTYAAVTGQPHLVAVAVSGAILELAALRQGTAEVTVTANDPEGLSASAGVEVVIPNRPPVAADTLADRRLPGPSRTVVVDVSGVFSDPDGDPLSIAAVSGDTSVVSVSISGFALTLAGGSQGGAVRVAVTATDLEGLSALAGFLVTVNRAPVLAEIGTRSVVAETPAIVLDLAPYASDPDGDSLAFEASSADTSVVSVSVSGTVLAVAAAGVRAAESAVTVTARDPNGLEDSAKFAVTVTENPDRIALEAVYHATAPVWGNQGNWLSDLPLRMWRGVRIHEDPAGSTGRVVRLVMSNLTGHLPSEIGDLEHLEYLKLRFRTRTSIPAELGNLVNLVELDMNGLAGPVPSRLGNLANLTKLFLWGRLTGSIPAELGNLANLTELTLQGVPIHLSGPIPPELSNLQNLERLYIGVPSCWAEYFAEHCAPYHRDLCAVDSMLSWLARFPGMGQVRRCGVGKAHLMQGVQTREGAVPLVAGEPALLRVFDRAPPFVARFYLAGAQVHMAEVHQLAFHGDLNAPPDALGSATVPGSVVVPGLEMVVEGERWRIPAEGRMAINVREMPALDLTLMWWGRADDPEREAHVAAIADSMAAAPHSYWRLRPLADLLPISNLSVAVHGSVNCSGTSPMSCVRAVRALQGGTGYWLGLTTGFIRCGRRLAAGCAQLGGRVAVAQVSNFGLELGVGIIAHELGHNMGLEHPPGGWPPVDPHYPHPDGVIGYWGHVPYDILWQECPAGRYGCGSSTTRLTTPAGFLDPLRTWDIMARTLSSAWSSPYHFTKALEYRLSSEGESAWAAREPVRSLLLWGDADSTGTPHLEPVFVVDAPPLLPDARGPWTIEGRDAGGAVLFSLPFDLPEIADAGEGAGGFTFVIPAGPGFEALASVTLSGPGGTATLDKSTDRPMSIWRDGDGKVRAILQGGPAQAGNAPAPLAGVALDVVTSRGIPSSEAWRR